MITDRDLWEEGSLKDALADIAEERGMRKSLVLALRGRLGTLTNDVTAAIEKANEKQLLDLSLHSGTDTIGQLRERLGLSSAL